MHEAGDDFDISPPEYTKRPMFARFIWFSGWRAFVEARWPRSQLAMLRRKFGWPS